MDTRKSIYFLLAFYAQEVIKINQEKYDRIIEEFAFTMNKLSGWKNE